MPRLRDRDRFFTSDEIGKLCDNVLIACSRPRQTPPREEKMGRLREFTEALIEPLYELVTEESITEEELRFILSAALVYVHRHYLAE